MSFKPEVIADSSGKWSGNALRFATREEAEANVQDLMMRWFAVRDTRVVECDDPVNYTYVDHKLLPFPAAEITPVPALDAVTQLQRENEYGGVKWPATSCWCSTAPSPWSPRSPSRPRSGSVSISNTGARSSPAWLMTVW